MLYTHILVMFLDDRFVESGGFLELVLLHEEDVRNVEFPRVVFVAELNRLTEDLLDLLVILQVPIDLGLLHQHRNVPANIHMSPSYKSIPCSYSRFPFVGMKLVIHHTAVQLLLLFFSLLPVVRHFFPLFFFLCLS